MSCRGRCLAKHRTRDA